MKAEWIEDWNDFLTAYDAERHKPDDFTKDAVSFLENYDVDYQEKSAERFFDEIYSRITVEYAFDIFRKRHIYNEVA